MVFMITWGVSDQAMTILQSVPLPSAKRLGLDSLHLIYKKWKLWSELTLIPCLFISFNVPNYYKYLE